ncbi:MAG: hydroxypyruvate reductase [Alphaproteobacteria bacterium BRH_c36]|nr:MAG: hydroxypyruvate reductase [Alphaproteobacteria bacterium BRH_c36]
MTTAFAAERSKLMKYFEAAVSAAHPSTCVPPHLPDVPQGGRIIVVGAGKAGAAMAQATERHYIARGEGDHISGFVTTRHGFGLPTEIIEIVEAGHPVPDANSVSSAHRALELVASAGPDDLILCLMSGGASALWSAPVDGVTFGMNQGLTKSLLRSGARISEMNCVRKHLSRIKGGRLAAAAAGKEMLTLAISDVPHDSPDAIGSGPTVGDATTLAEARAILAHYNITPPPEVARALETPANETPFPGSPAFARSRFVFAARPLASMQAAAVLARKDGYRVDILGDSLEGEARDVAAFHAAMAKDALRRGDRVALMSGGELTVTVRGEGSGGPNQEYALGLAIALGGTKGIFGIACDTDGTDGGIGKADDPAGAVVLPDTVTRAKASGVDAVAFLDDNDSTGFFRRIGDLVMPGPTQTNVNDFRVVLVDP